MKIKLCLLANCRVFYSALSGKSSFNVISARHVCVVCPSLNEGRLNLIRLDHTASALELGRGIR